MKDSDSHTMSRDDEPSSISLDVLPLVIGRGSRADVRCLEKTISRQHARVERRGSELYVVDLKSKFGTFVNGVRVLEKILQLGDLLQFGLRLRYRVGLNKLERLVSGGVSLHLQGVEIAVGPRKLVSGITLNVPAGSLVGMLGPSGVGKSMLLQVLAGICPPSNGKVGTDRQEDIWQAIEDHRARLAFIPQDDVLYGNLTLRENLTYAARLRLGESLTEEQRELRIASALETLGLTEHAEKLTRILSGGQRKRLSVALEWLHQPELLLLDEPTAGLDPANEARVMEQLAQVARRGSTVVCTTHLMENVRLFDQVAVLALVEGEGRLIYWGTACGLLEHFGYRHYADLYDALESGDFPSSQAVWPVEGSTSEPVNGRSSSESRPAIKAGDPRGSRRSPNRETATEAESGEARFHLMLGDVVARTGENSGMLQAGVVLARSAKLIWRDSWLRTMMILQPILLAIAVSLIQFDAAKMDSLYFFMAVVACWLGMNNSIRDLVRDRRHYVRDRLAGLLAGAYLGAKVVVFAIVGFCQLTLFLLLTFWMSQAVLPETHTQGLTVRMYFWILFCMMGVYLGGTLLALLVSTLVKSEEAAVAWLPILMLPQILFSAPATGVLSRSYSDARPFRPIVVTLRYPTSAVANPESEKLKTPAMVVDLLSLAVLTRPAIPAIRPAPPRGFSEYIWLGDLAHLTILDLVAAIALWLTFCAREKGWPVLAGR